jgi:hypothetical protein
MRYITYLSQKQHWLIHRCARLFEVWQSSSSRHGLVGDTKANPSRILPLNKSWAQLSPLKNQQGKVLPFKRPVKATEESSLLKTVTPTIEKRQL